MAAGVVAALVIGFLAGLLAFKVKTRWCPQCGSLTSDLQRERHEDEMSACPPHQ